MTVALQLSLSYSMTATVGARAAFRYSKCPIYGQGIDKVQMFECQGVLLQQTVVNGLALSA